MVVYLTNLTDHGRVLRQIEIIASRYDVIVAATGGRQAIPGIEFVELAGASPGGVRRRAEPAGRLALRMLGRYGAAYWFDSKVRSWKRTLDGLGPIDAMVVNDLAALPLARALAGSAVVFDAHEHWTSESASWSRRQRISMRGAHEWIVDRHAAHAAGIMTVSAGIAEDYRARIGRSPALVTNAPFFRQLVPTPVAEPIRLLHVGIADPRRRLEDTIEAVRSLDDRFVLDIVVRPHPSHVAYHRSLVALAQDEPRIRMLPPVPNDQLIAFANGYDIGVFLLPAKFPNQVHVLPNKFFDYIQARLAVAIGPSPEMAALVERWDCGVVADSFAPQSLATALHSLTISEVARMKVNADRAAAVLTADGNRDAVLALVEDALVRGRERSPTPGTPPR